MPFAAEHAPRLVSFIRGRISTTPFILTVTGTYFKQLGGSETLLDRRIGKTSFFSHLCNVKSSTNTWFILFCFVTFFDHQQKNWIFSLLCSTIFLFFPLISLPKLSWKSVFKTSGIPRLCIMRKLIGVAMNPSMKYSVAAPRNSKACLLPPHRPGFGWGSTMSKSTFSFCKASIDTRLKQLAVSTVSRIHSVSCRGRPNYTFTL